MTAAITLYTDGGNRNTGNQKGGAVRPTDKSAWAAYMEYGEYTKLISGGAYGKTNNYMEINAVIQGLRAIKDKTLPVNIYSDSAYAVNTMQQRWWVKWQQNNWVKGGQPVKNAALWRALLKELAGFTGTVTFNKVKGHATNQNNNKVDHALNQVMDQMATKH